MLLFSPCKRCPCPCSDAVLRSCEEALAGIILHRPPSLWFAWVWEQGDIWGGGAMVSGPGLLPPPHPRVPPPLPPAGCLRQQSQGSSTCGATSQRYRALHDCLFCGGKLQNTVRTGKESTTQATGGRRRRVLMQRSTSAPDDGYTTATEAPSATENRENRYLQCSSNRNKDDNTTIDK